MEMKNAIAVCLISFVSATLVMLIARGLDSQAASRLEPQLARIVDELQAIRAGGGALPVAQSATANPTMKDGLVVYYFYSNTRCPTCRQIEAQAHDVLQTDFANQLSSGQITWTTLNYEKPDVADLATKFEIQMPVVVLAQMDDGQMGTWTRLDKVWGLVGDQSAFHQYIRDEVNQLLTPDVDLKSNPAESDSSPADAPSLPTPEIPLPTP